MMKKSLKLSALLAFCYTGLFAQTNPAITSWLINDSGTTGRYYVSGNSTPFDTNVEVNVQRVQYSDNYAYINSTGIPAYIVGPYQDGNPAEATDNEWTFKIPLSPTANTGTPTETVLGAIGVFINGVPMYDYKDAQSYSNGDGEDSGSGDGVWNRNAILAEMDGFDCSKGHPSPIFGAGPGGGLEGGTYHHHQNPTAFSLDESVVSDVCDLYAADGLYTMDPSEHSPLIGYAFDGYPVYGAYGYANTDGTGGIVRIESSYQTRNITVRTHYADGTDVTDGPNVSPQYPLGWYKEDYEYVANSGHLDEHNGRFCVTPEYPDGTYAYFATVDENENSAYPYIIGPEFYGVVETSNFVSGGGSNSVTINESVTEYDPNATVDPTAVDNLLNNSKINVFPNPATDVVVVQVEGIVKEDLHISMYDAKGTLIKETVLRKGSTMWYLNTQTLYEGVYFVHISDKNDTVVSKIVVQR